MKESKFNSEVVASIRAAGGWAHKIADLPVSIVVGLRYTPEKPFDISAVVAGKPIAIEGKMFRKFQAFGLRHLRPSQIENFDKFVAAGGKAFIFVNVRQKANKEKGLVRENRLYYFEWKEWSEFLKSGKSIKKKQFENELVYLVGKGYKKKRGYTILFGGVEKIF